MSCNSYSKPYSIILLKQYASATIKNITPYFFSCFVLLFDHSTLFILRPLAVSKSFNLVDFSALSQGCSFLNMRNVSFDQLGTTTILHYIRFMNVEHSESISLRSRTEVNLELFGRVFSDAYFQTVSFIIHSQFLNFWKILL